MGEEQLAALRNEWEPGAQGELLFGELERAFMSANERERRLASADWEATRTVGKEQLPATLGGLLVHVADHTRRHVGQAITTAKLVATL